jgi:hypothetical protein
MRYKLCFNALPNTPITIPLRDGVVDILVQCAMQPKLGPQTLLSSLHVVRNKSKTILLQANAAVNRTLGAVHWMPVPDQAVDGPPYEGHANSNDKHNRPSTLTRRGQLLCRPKPVVLRCADACTRAVTLPISFVDVCAVARLGSVAVARGAGPLVEDPTSERRRDKPWDVPNEVPQCVPAWPTCRRVSQSVSYTVSMSLVACLRAESRSQSVSIS